MIVVAWVLGCWCVASLVGGAAWSAYRTVEKRHERTRTQFFGPRQAGSSRGPHRTPSNRPRLGECPPPSGHPGDDLVVGADPPASGVDVDVSVTNVSMDRPDAGAIVSKVGLPGTSEPREAGAQ